MAQQDQPPQLQPLPSAPQLPFQMKANLSEYRRRLGALRFVVAIILLSLVYFRFGVIGGAITTSIVVLVVAIILTVQSKRALIATKDGIVYTGAFGKKTSFRYDEISTVKVFLGYIETGFGPAPRIIVGKSGGGFYFTMTTLYWKVEEIDLLLAIIQDKQIVIETYETPADSAMISKQFPDHVAAFERHPYWMATGIVLLILVAVIVFVLLVM